MKYIVGWINTDGTSGIADYRSYNDASLHFKNLVAEEAKSVWIDAVDGRRLASWEKCDG